MSQTEVKQFSATYQEDEHRIYDKAPVRRDTLDKILDNCWFDAITVQRGDASAFRLLEADPKSYSQHYIREDDEGSVLVRVGSTHYEVELSDEVEFDVSY